MNLPEPTDFDAIAKMIVSLEENIKSKFPENSRIAWDPVVSILLPPIVDCLNKMKDAIQSHENTLYEIIRKQNSLLAQQSLTGNQT